MELTKQHKAIMLILIVVAYFVFVAICLYWQWESHKKLMEIYEEALVWDKAIEHK